MIQDYTQISEHMILFRCIDNINLKYQILAIVLFVSMGCARKNLFTIDRYSKNTFDRNLIYSGYREYLDHDGVHKLKTGSLFFEDGSVLVRALRENESLESFLDANQLEIYDNNKVDWGRYKIVSDTIYIEFVKNIRSGGGIKFGLLEWKGVVKNGTLAILPGPAKKYRNSVLQFIYPETGIKLKEDGEKVNVSIDPSKAWINN